MSRIVLVLTFAMVAIANCQDCNSQFDKLRDCVKQKWEEQRTTIEAEKKKRQEDVKQCFTSNQCTEPNFNSTKTNKGGAEFFKGKGKGHFDGGESGGKRRDCMKTVGEKARSYVEKCIQEKYPSFRFPEVNKTHPFGGPGGSSGTHGGPGGFGGHGGSGHRGGFGFIGQAINESCPEATREAVQTCLRNLWQKQNPDEWRAKEQQRFNESCKIKDTCFSQLSTDCQTQFNETKNLTCSCAQDMVNTQKVQLDKELDLCMGKTNASQSNSFGFGRFQASFTDMFAKRLCENRDHCHGGAMGHGGIGGWKGKGHGFGGGKGRGFGGGSRGKGFGGWEGGRGKGNGRGGQGQRSGSSEGNGNFGGPAKTPPPKVSDVELSENQSN